ncbi:MAG: undecaprenyl-diphosphate phosphatase [Butyricicoccaceae bacterium]
MLDIIKSVIFGIIEGITEWLPISSTGHLILAEEFLSFKNVSEGFWSMYEVVIQLGAILAVVVIFWDDIFPFTNQKGLGLQPTGALSHVKKKQFWLWVNIIVACVPAAVVGILFDDVLERLFYKYYVVAIALIVFGIAFIVVENWNATRSPRITSVTQLTMKTVLIIGAFQLIAAIFPGTSRSGATIVGALLIGVSRKVAAEFTFYLAIPVMFGASLLKILKFGLGFTVMEAVILLVGMIVSFAVSIVVIKFLMDYIKKHDFKVFGYYRIVLGIVVLLYFFLVK